MTIEPSAYEALMQFLYRAPVGLAQVTLDGTVELMNPMSAQLLMPVTATGSLSNLFETLRDRVPHLRATVEAFEPGHGVICESQRFALEEGPDDSPRVLSISVMKIDASRLMVVLDDATAEVAREQEANRRSLRDAARIDPLTQIPNRLGMVERLQAALSASGEGEFHAAVLLIGCPRLKAIGDQFGNLSRDRLLAAMVRRLYATLRANDCVGCAGDPEPMAARVSGDEFVVLLRRLREVGDAVSVSRRIVEAMSHPFSIDGEVLQCPVSVGIVDPISGDAPEAVLRDASIALGEAQRTHGSRCMLFDIDMRERAIRRGGIESELRRALVNDELFVVYQPVVDLQASSVRLAGVEALVRWRHPERGVVPPIEFIPVAEESGLIGALGELVLATACRQFATWRSSLGPLAPSLMAVNLSRAQLDDAGLVDTIAGVLASSGMAAGELQLEVTESLAAQDDGVQAHLARLKGLGVKIALDDFGTGYSSLSSLHLLPVDTVKIDRSFVTLLEKSPHHRVLIEATILVAHSLGMSTVAEGIEGEGQAAIIRDLACEKGQGYLFSRPLSGDDVAAWILERAARDDAEAASSESRDDEAVAGCASVAASTIAPAER